EAGELPVVGVNTFTETAPSPLVSGYEGGEAYILELDPAAEAEQIEHLTPATIELAKAGGTVGEWASALREVFGEYRAPTGVGAVAAAPVDEMGNVAERGQSGAAGAAGARRVLGGKPA